MRIWGSYYPGAGDNNYGQATKLPQAPDFVEGIINLRGKIIPIIDLKKRFHMGASEITSDTRSVVVEVEGQTVGIIVMKSAKFSGCQRIT